MLPRDGAYDDLCLGMEIKLVLGTNPTVDKDKGQGQWGGASTKIETMY